MRSPCNWCGEPMKVKDDADLHLHRLCRREIKERVREIDTLLNRYRTAS